MIQSENLPVSNSLLLSICVLSYNQLEAVKRLLGSISNQYCDEVEVLMRDDSTNEQTAVFVKEFTLTNFPIRFFRGKKEGIDKTIIFLTEQAKGKFTWWLGDDDLADNAIQKVLKTIKENEDVSFIWANYLSSHNYQLAINLEGDQYFKTIDQTLELGGLALGFISSTILKTENAKSNIESSRKYIGSEFVNLYITLSVISGPGKSYYIKGPIVICHPASSDEIQIRTVKENGEIVNNGFQVFGINYSNILLEFRSKFSPSVLEKSIKLSFRYAWKGVFVGWVGGWDTPDGKRLKILKYYWTFPEAWIALSTFSIPLQINKYLYSIYKKRKSKGLAAKKTMLNQVSQGEK